MSLFFNIEIKLEIADIEQKFCGIRPSLGILILNSFSISSITLTIPNESIIPEATNSVSSLSSSDIDYKFKINSLK